MATSDVVPRESAGGMGKQRIVNDMSIQVATVNGSGSQSSNTVLLRSIFQMGVPVSGKVNLDAILAIAQLPPGVPAACVGLDRGDNAALLAVQMLAIADKALADKLAAHKKKQAEKVAADSKSVEGL